MKKLLFLLITLAALVPWAANAQTTVTIGDLTSSQYTLPVNMFYNYSLTQQLYTAEEITEAGGGAGTITSISFYYNHTDAFSMDSVRIYMLNVDRESFANSTDMEVVTENDLVFEGTFSGPAQPGWVTITLDTPFEYDGTSNLLVCCYDPSNGFPGNSFRFITSGTTESASVAYYSDTYIPDLTSISSFIGSKNIYQYHNCIQLEFNFSGETVCAKPSNVVVSGITADAATLSWKAGNGQTAWQVYCATDTVDFDQISWVSVSDTFHTFTGLTPNTQYTVYVRTVCGSEVSGVRSKTFNTNLIAAQLPFSCDFEDPNVNARWAIRNGDQTNQWYIGSAVNHTEDGANALYISHDNGVTNAYDTASTSAVWAFFDVDFSDANEFALSFDYRVNGEGLTTLYDYMKVFVGTPGDVQAGSYSTPENATQIGAYNLQSAWQNASLSLPGSYANTTQRIYFLWRNDGTVGTNPPAAVDNISIASVECARPSSLVVSDVSDNSVTLTWHETGSATAWNVAYGPAGFTVDENANIVTVTDTTATIGNLTPSQMYDFYVRSDCGEDVSEWRGPVHATPGSFIFGVTGDSTITACGLVIYDNGGFDGNYSENCNYTLTVYPSEPDSVVSISGTHHCESTYDLLRIYNGVSTDAADLLYSSYSNSSAEVSFGPITSELGPLTIQFTSDYSIQYAGFAATVSCVAAPSCRKPYDLVVNASVNEATLSWTAPGGQTAWQVYCDTGTVDYDQITWVSVTDTFHTFTGLTSNTQYTAYVRAICGSDESDVRTLSFRTNLVAATMPFICDFEDATVNSLWAIENGNQTNQWYIGSAVNQTEGGANALYISNDNGVTNAYDTASTSTVWAFFDVEFSEANEFALSFDYRVNGEGASTMWDYLKVFVGTPSEVQAGSYSTPENATQVGAFNLQTSWQNASLSLPGSYANTTQRIYFLWRNDNYMGANPPAAVDNISLVAVACAHPTTPVVSNVMGHSADLTWNAYGAPVNIYYKTDADTVFTLVNESPVNDTTYTLTGLNADTPYEVYVAAVCDDQSENPSSHVSFRTTCTTEMAPYSEDFAGFNINPSACWQKYSGLASAVLTGGSLNPTNSGWNYNSSNVFPLGHPKLNIYGSSCFYWLVSPAIDLSQLSVPVLTFSLALTKYNNSTPIDDPENQIDDQFMVVISTDDGATWTAANATVWNNIGTGDYAYNAISHTGDDILIPLSQYGDSTIRIAFYGESTVSGNGDNDLHIADVQVKEMPACVRPNGLVVSDVSDNSVTLVWQEEGTATTWNVAYGPAGFTIDENADIVTVTDTTATIGNLTPAQTYDFYVQSNCGDGVSEWRGPVQASPGVFIFGVTGSSSITACGLVIYDNGGPDGNYSNNCNYILTVYPSEPDSVVSISGTHHCESTYDLLRIYNGTSTDEAELLYSSLSNTSDEVSFGPVTSTTGPLTIWFTSDYSVQHAGFAATLSCVAAPDCRAPYDLTVNASADEATVSWTNMDDGATIELYYKESSDSVYTTISASAFTGGNSYVMTNLTPATTYDVYVATLCDNGDTLATPVHTFTTQCVAISTYPFVEDFAPASPTLSCWTVINANNDTKTFTYNTTNECMYYPYHSANPADDWLVSPMFVMNGSQIADFDYWAATSWAEMFQVFAIAADGTETALSQIVTVQTDVHQNLVIDLSELVGSYQIGIHCVSDADRFNLYVDNFRVRDAEVAELTVDPTSMSFSTVAGVASSSQMAVVSSLNLNSDITVTATAPFEVSTDGSTFSSNITITVSAMFTNDTLYVRYNPTVPGTDNGSVTFTGGTETATITVTGVAADCSPRTLPYAEDFDSYTNGISTSTYPTDYPEGDLPTCWLFPNRSTSSSEYPMAFLSSSSDYAVSGNCLFFKSCSTTPLYAVLPDFIGDIHDMKLRFTYRNEGTTSSNGTLSVGYMTDPDDITTFNEVATFAQISTLTTDSVLFNTIPASVTTANIVFKYTGGTFNNYYLSIDDVIVEEFVPVIIDPTIVTEAATAIGQTTATLNATITNPDNVNVTAKGFEWKATAGGTYSQIAGTGEDGTFTANLIGLAPNTSYTFKAFITFNGITVYGNELTFTTLPEDTPEPCEAPTGLQATNVENEAIAITWDANASVNDWNVRYRPITEDPWTFVTVNTNSYTITGLTGKTTYEIQVQANCSDGNISGWSGSITAQTTDVGIVTHLENSIVLFPNPANDVVNVQCTMNNVQCSGIEVMDVYGKVVRTVVGANNDSPTQINVSGLAAGMYFVRVTTEQGVATKTFVKK